MLRDLERQRKGRALFAYETALVHLALSERERALEMLERACRENSGWMAYLAVDPRLDPVRGDRRFEALRAVTLLKGVRHALTPL